MKHRYRLILAIVAAAGPAGAYAASYPKVEYVRTLPTVKEFTKPRSFFGKLVNFVAGPPEGKPEIVRPYATTHDGMGRLIIADPGQQGVHIFDFEAHKYQFLKGPRGNHMASPIDVACDAANNIYVTDSMKAHVYVFDQRGKFVRMIGDAGTEHLKRPTGMYLDQTAKRIYLADTLRHQLLVFGLDGSLHRVIGKRGTGAVEFNYPTAVTLALGKLYVVDAMNFRIQALTTDGNYLGSFGQLGVQSGTLNRPKGIAADSDGNLYVVDALFETVQVFDSKGQLLYYFGSGGTKPGEFQLPSGISIDNRNLIYVADSMNRRVQVFRYRRPLE